MANLVYSITLSPNTLASAIDVETKFSDVKTWLNNRDNSSDSWLTLKVTGASVLGATLAVTGATTLSSTLGVVGIASFADGAVGTPSITFTSNSNTGFYALGSNRIGVTQGGAQTWVFTGAGDFGTAATGRFLAGDGSLSSPGFQFNADANTGVYRIGNDNIGIVTGGVKAIDISSSQVVTLASALAVASGGTGIANKIFATGTYTGNGGVGHTVAHGLGATPDFVIIADNTTNNNIPEIFITGMGASSHDFNGTRQTNAITAVDGTNLTLGVNNAVNQNTVTYSFVAFKAQ